MYPGFSNWFLRPFQLLLFFQVAIIGALITGQSFLALALDARGGDDSGLSQSAWIGIAGAVIFLLSLIPTLSQMWQLSLLGTVCGVAATVVALVGCIIAMVEGSRETAHFGRPPTVGTGVSAEGDYAFGVLSAFGIIAFAYGGHSVLPDVQASLHNNDVASSHRSMVKGLTYAYYIIAPCYFAICILGYAAFGADVSGFVVYSLEPYIGLGLQVFLWVLTILNGLALTEVYIQAAFTLLEDIFPCLGHHYDGRMTVEQVCTRFVFIALATFVAIAIPFFAYLSALVGAVCFTLLTFVYPFIFWNRSKEAEKASAWKVKVNRFCAGSFTLLGIAGAIGALYLIISQSSTYTFFQ
jgi:hypothetical protein